MKHLLKSLKESAFSVLPIAAIVLILSVSLAPIKAGATGGTVIKGRLAESEKLNAIIEMELQEERESIIILAPADVSTRILEDANEKYGLRSKARGILCAVPVEKAYKI